MSTHPNYSRQFAVWFQSAQSRRDVRETFRPLYSDALKAMRGAPKVMLPHGGKLMEDPELRALQGMPVRLPLPVTVFEYSASAVRPESKTPHNDDSTKRIIIAEDGADGLTIKVTSVFYMDSLGVWTVVPFAIKRDSLEAYNGTYKVQASVPQFARSLEVQEDLRAEMMILMGTLNALACRNVRLTPSRYNRPKGATPKGAIPFDDYHVLTIDGQRKASEGDGTGSHRSPREHLRRGHIRRLGSGPIWVNATVVNPGIGGKVFKDYAMGAA